MTPLYSDIRLPAGDALSEMLFSSAREGYPTKVRVEPIHVKSSYEGSRDTIQAIENGAP
jgi:hypothetical protein